MKKANKILPIIIGIILVVAIVIVGIILVVGNKGHRVIKVDNVTGEASLERKANEQEIYENINLKSEDAVITGQDGQVELLIDSDKHVLARENTKFKVVSSGNENKGKLKIELLYGTSLVEIENKLPKDATFEVETPNATIGVRGTIFETSYDEDENKTVVVVTSGVVEVTTDTETVMVEEGQKAIVVDDVVKDIEENIEENITEGAVENSAGDVDGNIGKNNKYELINDSNKEDFMHVDKIIYVTEKEKLLSTTTNEEIATFESVPNSSVTYVGVDGSGLVSGRGIRGVHFQGYCMTLEIVPRPGYHYVGCESDTIELDFETYDTPSFIVPESGEHIIYVYFAPNE